MKKIVAYFSATGVTAGVASNLADAIGADLFEIAPLERYTKEDLNWWEESSRSTREMKDLNARPQIARQCSLQDYDIIYVGFPIWWNVAPRIINTFLESYDLTGKTIFPFATSSGSGIDKVNESISVSCPAMKLQRAKLFQADAEFRELSNWAEEFYKV